jgi:hypothetical protein
MNVFRLVLCLAGLAAYLVAKQWFEPGAPPSSPADSPSAAPASNVRHTVSISLPPKTPTVPHAEHGIVKAAK